jgi:hypothetical protein
VTRFASKFACEFASDRCCTEKQHTHAHVNATTLADSAKNSEQAFQEIVVGGTFRSVFFFLFFRFPIRQMAAVWYWNSGPAGWQAYSALENDQIERAHAVRVLCFFFFFFHCEFSHPKKTQKDCESYPQVIPRVQHSSYHSTNFFPLLFYVMTCIFQAGRPNVTLSSGYWIDFMRFEQHRSDNPGRVRKVKREVVRAPDAAAERDRAVWTSLSVCLTYSLTRVQRERERSPASDRDVEASPNGRRRDRERDRRPRSLSPRYLSCQP